MKKEIKPKTLRCCVRIPAPSESIIGTPVFMNGKKCGTIESISKDQPDMVYIVVDDSQTIIELMYGGGAGGISIGGNND